MTVLVGTPNSLVASTLGCRQGDHGYRVVSSIVHRNEFEKGGVGGGGHKVDLGIQIGTAILAYTYGS